MGRGQHPRPGDKGQARRQRRGGHMQALLQQGLMLLCFVVVVQSKYIYIYL